MKKLLFGIAGVVLLAQGASLLARGPQASRPTPTVSERSSSQAPRPAPSHQVADVQPGMVAQYCVGCHNERTKARAGGLSLEGFDDVHPDKNPEVAEKMIRKLRAGMMPPPGQKRPDPAVIASFVSTLESRIDEMAAARPNPGSRVFQRLNRAEYARAVRDLLALDVDMAAFLPPDTINNGFDNVADEQSFSPVLMESFLRAASQISRLAIGDRNASPTSATYKIGRNFSQMRHVEGTPMGTRGGVSVVHNFPADGEYTFKAAMHYEPLGGLYGRSTMTVYDVKEQIEVSINGERVAVMDLNTRMSESDPSNSLEVVTPKIHVKAGPQRVSAAFIQRLEGPIDDLLMPVENTLADVSISFGITVLPHMRDFTVSGPFTVTGVSDSPSRRKVFACRPTDASEEATCASQIVKTLASQAYREPVAADDFNELMTFFRQGREKGDFESGIRLAVQAMLASPKFLFRLEQTPAAARAGQLYRLNDIDLASRLSFFLWGTVPDAELVKAASQGLLKTPGILDKQVKRLLADPRSEALATRFASQWLRLQDLEKLHPDYLFYPQYDDTLARAMERETQLFFDSIVREDRNVLDLFTADYSFVNERLAIHYGIPNITGNEFRRVQMPEYRRGLLGHGSILASTSYADRTSPVLRGKWVLEVLLGSPPPPAPPDVPPFDETKAVANGKMLSVRERMEEHRRNPQCQSCHRVMDPLGLALENFDPTGAWRIKDNEVPVDPNGTLYDGQKLDGPASVRDALLKHSDVLLNVFTENLMTYALGRRVEYFDMPAIRTITRDAARNNNRFSSFVLGVVNSQAFRMGKADPATLTDETQPAGRAEKLPVASGTGKPAGTGKRR
jgi:mono/diheme cytochrome c family protein